MGYGTSTQTGNPSLRSPLDDEKVVLSRRVKPASAKSPLGLRLIAAAKLAKGAALGLLSFGVFDLIDKDLTALVHRLVEMARISPENHYVGLILEKLGLVDRQTLIRLGLISALYATILLTEGVGLWIGAAWAEYMVVISTGAFVPEEIMATVDHFTWARFAILGLNVVILAYVATLVWRRYRERRASGSPA